jgi:hypothetical protein
VNAKGAKI